jgi:hypothetical protein
MTSHPTVLFHGTSSAHWDAIQQCGALLPEEPPRAMTVSLTECQAVALYFARLAADPRRDQLTAKACQLRPIVLAVNAVGLALDPVLYEADGWGDWGNWEHEWASAAPIELARLRVLIDGNSVLPNEWRAP